MKIFAPRALYVYALFLHEKICILFACETKQNPWESVTVKQLDFDGNVISMDAHAETSGKRQSHSMGIAFLSKRRGLIIR